MNLFKEIRINELYINISSIYFGAELRRINDDNFFKQMFVVFNLA